MSVTGAPPRVESCLVSLVLPVAAGAAHGICCQFGVLETANVALLCRDRLETCNLYELEIRKKEHESVIVFFTDVFILGHSVPAYTVTHVVLFSPVAKN